MDDQRSISREYGTWHYIDLPPNVNITAADVMAYRDSDPSNVYLALTTYCLPTLKDPAAPLAERARALGFFLHLAGDIHQPLHATGPLKGGNGYAVDPLPSADPHWAVKNLHAFWDNAYRYGNHGGTVTLLLSSNDFPRITAPEQDPIEGVAKMIEAKYLPASLGSVTDLDPADWAVESDKIASTFVYPADGSHTLTAGYVQKAHDIACRRMALAGLREAAVLNLLLGSSYEMQPVKVVIDGPPAEGSGG